VQDLENWMSSPSCQELRNWLNISTSGVITSKTSQAFRQLRLNRLNSSENEAPKPGMKVVLRPAKKSLQTTSNRTVDQLIEELAEEDNLSNLETVLNDSAAVPVALSQISRA